MRRILVVEDEQMLRESMARGLAKLPAQVHQAATIAAACAALDAEAPDLVISDIDLPDRSGIELIGELGKRGMQAPIMFVSAYVRAYRAQIPPHARVEVLEKPIPLEHLRARARHWLGELETRDDQAPFCVAEYVQLAGHGRHSVEILIEGERPLGRIVMMNGDLWTATDSGGRGLDAFRRLAFAAATTVQCRTFAGDPGPRTITGKWDAVLVDAARQIDEARGVDVDADLDLDAAFRESADPPMDAPPSAAFVAAPDDEYAAVWDQAIAAQLGKDYLVALRWFLEAERIRPDDALVSTNLARLATLGFRAEPATRPENHP
jgi:CheY-like chemotaxis protein